MKRMKRLLARLLIGKLSRITRRVKLIILTRSLSKRY